MSIQKNGVAWGGAFVTDGDRDSYTYQPRSNGSEGTPAQNLEGQRNYEVYDPDTGNTITDIDAIVGGVLWEEKTARFANNIPQWVSTHITAKFNKYLKAREQLPGYENAPIGFKFTEGPPLDAAFERAIVDEIDRLRTVCPSVDLRLEW